MTPTTLFVDDKEDGVWSPSPLRYLIVGLLDGLRPTVDGQVGSEMATALVQLVRDD